MKIHLEDWTVKAIDEKCVEIIINDNVDISGLSLKLIDENRATILKLFITSHKISLCSYTNKPVYAQLDDCVKYVEHSGCDTYKKIKTNV